MLLSLRLRAFGQTLVRGVYDSEVKSPTLPMRRLLRLLIKIKPRMILWRFVQIQPRPRSISRFLRIGLRLYCGRLIASTVE